MAVAAAFFALLIGLVAPRAEAATPAPTATATPAGTASTANPAADPVTSAAASSTAASSTDALVCSTASGSIAGGASVVGHDATSDPVVGMAEGANGTTWRVTSSGDVVTTGVNYGDATGYHLAKPVVGIAATSDGLGYWIVTSDGRVFPFGDATFYGSLRTRHVSASIVAMASTPDGRGYWLAAADGQVFRFGDAQLYGSAAGMKLNQPVVGIAPTTDGRGYWLVATDGGVFSFGDATFYGSEAGGRLASQVSAVVARPAGAGYWLVARSGAVTQFGSATSGTSGQTSTSAPLAVGCGDIASRFATRPGSVVVGGDSITVASSGDLSADLAAEGAQVSFVDHIGWSLEAGTSGLVEQAAYEPGAVVVAFGTNDWYDGASSTGIASYQAALRRVLASLPTGQRVLWVLPYWSALRTPVISSDQGIQGDLQRLNLASAATLAGYSNVQVLDMNAVFDGEAPLVGPDGLHPTSAGATRWATAVASALEE